MKVLLDEHFSPEIARQLRDRGRDVVAARERPDLHGLSDHDLLRIATVERRVLVTENVADFAELHRLSLAGREEHAGIVLTSAKRFPRTRRAIGRLIGALDALVDAHPGPGALAGQSWWL